MFWKSRQPACSNERIHTAQWCTMFIYDVVCTRRWECINCHRLATKPSLWKWDNYSNWTIKQLSHEWNAQIIDRTWKIHESLNRKMELMCSMRKKHTHRARKECAIQNAMDWKAHRLSCSKSELNLKIAKFLSVNLQCAVVACFFLCLLYFVWVVAAAANR